MFTKMQFDTFTCPLTFHAISSINNTAQLKEDAGAFVSFTLTPGNYTSADFCTEVKTRLQATGVGTYTVTVSSTTGKLTISVAGAASTFSIKFTQGNRQMEKIWGVPEDTAQNQINNVAAASYTSTNVCVLWGPDQILVTSSTLVKMLVNRNTDVVDAQSNILFKFPITNSLFYQQTNTYSTEYLTVNQQMMPTTISIDVTDQ